MLHGIGRVVMVALFAGFIALQTVVGLINTNVKGIAGMGQDTGTKQQRWDEATEWSAPEKGKPWCMFIPGIFGYKMDTPLEPHGCPECSAGAYRNGGAYWGGMGRTPSFDRWLGSGAQGNPPPAFRSAGDTPGIIAASSWCCWPSGPPCNPSAGRIRFSPLLNEGLSGSGRW